jgi:hypothetical protein
MKAMTDQQRKARDEAAINYAGASDAHDAIDFKVGADYWHARARVLEEALEQIIETCLYSDMTTPIAREALIRYRDGGGAE